MVGYGDIKACLSRVLSFSSPFRREQFRRFGLELPGGVLLHGPPGQRASSEELIPLIVCFQEIQKVD